MNLLTNHEMRALGRAAYWRGVRRAPALDTELPTNRLGTPGQAKDLLRAWLDGWDDACNHTTMADQWAMATARQV